MLGDINIVRRAEVTEIVEFLMAKIHEKTEAKGFETVATVFEDDLQSNYLYLDEGLKSALFNIVHHTLTQVVCAGQGGQVN